jgi:hypothetical protein
MQFRLSNAVTPEFRNTIWFRLSKSVTPEAMTYEHRKLRRDKPRLPLIFAIQSDFGYSKSVTPEAMTYD